MKYSIKSLMMLMLSTTLAFSQTINYTTVNGTENEAVTTTINQTENLSGNVWLVKPKPGKSNDVEKHVKNHSNKNKSKHYNHIGITRVECDDVNSLYTVFKDADLIDYMVPDSRVSINSTLPSDPLWSGLWNMTNISMPQAWDISTGNVDIVVAIIDTGVDYTHPDLIGNLWTVMGDNGTNIHGYESFGGVLSEGGSEQYGHGTHVAGTIGATANNAGVVGVSWNVKMMSLAFLNQQGWGNISDAIAVLDKMVELKLSGVNILVNNNSWGGGGSEIALKDAFQTVENNGILSICAAGNNAVDTDVTSMIPGSMDNRGIVSVLASDSKDFLANFSNYGTVNTDIAAPGVNILSTMANTTNFPFNNPTGYGTMSGTSMATPHVSGLAALLFSINPNLSVYEARDIILNHNSYDSMKDQMGLLSSTGGRINAYKTLTNPLITDPKTNTFPILTSVVYNDVTGNETSVISFTGQDADGDPLFSSFIDISGRIAALTNYVPYTFSNYVFDVTKYFAVGMSDRNGGAVGKSFPINIYSNPNYKTPYYEIGVSSPAVWDSRYYGGGYYNINFYFITNTPPLDPEWKIVVCGSNFISLQMNSIPMSMFPGTKYPFANVNTNSSVRIYGLLQTPDYGISRTSNREIIRLGTDVTNTANPFPELEVTFDKLSGPTPFTFNYYMTNTVNETPVSSNYFYISLGNGFNSANNSIVSTNLIGSFTLTKVGIWDGMLILQNDKGWYDYKRFMVSVTEPPNVPPCDPPSIVSQPTSRTVFVGESVSFNVTADGTTPLTYQWKLDGNDITGKTDSTLLILNSQLSDQGNYEVVVSNPCGQIKSSVATLVVNVPTPPAPTLNAVTDLSVTDNGSMLTLNWTDNSTGEDRYEVQVAKKKKGPWGAFSTFSTLPANSNSIGYVKQSGYMYQFRVRAAYKTSYAPYSNVITIKPK